ncbi:MAG: hypothetical protein FGF50_09350 [Candidatus Brockarchaeota archaeon]|nr:hypothetical protein [Candidatus Brockarchaeota archaeon]
MDWAKVPLPNVAVNGDFYVCVYPMLEPNGTQLWVAVDSDMISGRSFLVDCYRQGLKKYEEGSAMIRVEGEEAVEFAEIIVDSISVREEGFKLTFRIVASGNIAEVKATLQADSLIKDHEVTYEYGFYNVMLNWSMFSGLKEPVRLMLSARTLNSTSTLTVKLSETIFSKYLRLIDENKFLKAMLNNSRLERETFGHKLHNKEVEITVLKASLEAYEKRCLNEVEEAKKLAEELNMMRFLTVSLAVFTISLFIIFVKGMRSASLKEKGFGKDA